MGDEGFWVDEREYVVDDRILTAERHLALVDRVIGLEAELAQVSAVSSLSLLDQLTAARELAAVKRSRAWRVGRLAVAPVAFAERASRVLRRRLGL